MRRCERYLKIVLPLPVTFDDGRMWGAVGSRGIAARCNSTCGPFSDGKARMAAAKARSCAASALASSPRSCGHARRLSAAAAATSSAPKHLRGDAPRPVASCRTSLVAREARGRIQPRKSATALPKSSKLSFQRARRKSTTPRRVRVV